jgi:hypothetical protein
MPQINNPLRTNQGGLAMLPFAFNLLHITPEVYYSNTGHLSSSLLREGYRNVELLSMHLQGYKDNRSTDSMQEGIQYHMAVLEPERYNASHLILDDTRELLAIGGAKPRSTNKYKEFMEKVEEEARAKKQTIVSIQQHTMYQNMLDRLANTPDIALLLNDTYRELAFEKLHLGVKMKGLIDATDGYNYHVDLKKIHLDKPGVGFNYEQLDKYIDLMDYDMQQWWYRQGIGTKDAYLLFQMDTYPYTPCLVKLSEDVLQRGKRKFEWMLSHIAKYLDGNGQPLNHPFFINIFI